MKKSMIVFLLIIVGLAVTVILQNKPYFTASQTLHINLWIWEYTTPEFYNGVLFLALFLGGLLLAYFSGLSHRYTSGKTIKRLEASLRSTMEMVTTLKNELKSLKGEAPVAPGPEAAPRTPAPDKAPDKAPEQAADQPPAPDKAPAQDADPAPTSDQTPPSSDVRPNNEKKSDDADSRLTP
ncbi:MAG: hypothetical protein GY859_11595 [Desulfobacterales bacterium]|nr:hypothetical protein [Desulfobacterales bacterium]